MYQNIHITQRTETEPATVHLWDDLHGYQTFPYSDFDYVYIPDKKGDKTSIYGDKVKRTFRHFRGMLNTFEADVPKETRVLSDLYQKDDSVATNHRVLNYDIEVGKVNGEFANTQSANGVITAITCHARERKQYTTFLLDPYQKLQPREQNREGLKLFLFDTEQELLLSFMEYYTEYQPTIITGWNSNGYDIPYLYRRLKLLFDDDVANALSPIGIVKLNHRTGEYKIAGVSCLDYLPIYKKFTYTRLPSYRLHEVGLYEIGLGKIEYDGSLDDLYNADIELFLEYNIRDVKIVAGVDDKMQFINLIIAVCHVGHVPYEDYIFPSRYIEGTILTYLHRQNRVAPNKPEGGREAMELREEEDEEGFAGAFVKPPVPGLYDWVYSLDLQSLYPSIIMSLNISPETKIGYGLNFTPNDHMNHAIDEYQVQIGDNVKSFTRDEFIAFMEKNKYNISSNGVIYRTDKLGIVPEILDLWFTNRLEYRKLKSDFEAAGDKEQADYYDRRQHIQKILLNSVYGYLGLPVSRFYDLDNAGAVTSTGQDVIKTSAKYVSSLYTKAGVPDRSEVWLENYRKILKHEVKKKRMTTEEATNFLSIKDHTLYIDTDSLYLSAVPLFESEENKMQQTVDIAKRMQKAINAFYDVMARKFFFCTKHRLVIQGESVCETAFWVAKKRYALWKVFDLEKNKSIPKDKQKMIAKGFDVVRSSFPLAFKGVASKILTQILNKAHKEEVDATILKFRESMDTLPFPDIARNTSVQNISEHDNEKTLGYKAFPKGVSAHVKSAIAYNRWLREHKVDNVYGLIRDGDKIKYAFLKDNPMGIDTMALKGYDDPPELVEFVSEHLDYAESYERELVNKIQNFYDAMRWSLIPTHMSQTIDNFFGF